MLNAITDGSLARSPMILSAGGQDEQPCEVNSSTTALGWASALPLAAMAAHTLSAPVHCDMPPKDFMRFCHARGETHNRRCRTLVSLTRSCPQTPEGGPS